MSDPTRAGIPRHPNHVDVVAEKIREGLMAASTRYRDMRADEPAGRLGDRPRKAA